MEFFRSARHFFTQEFDQLRALSFQKEENFLDQLSVLFRRDETTTGGEAFFYLMIQAGAGTVAKVGLLAGAQGEQVPQGLEGFLDGCTGRVRAEVTGSVPFYFAHQGESGKLFVDVEFEAEIGLIVFEVDIVAGFMFLDQGILQDQGFFFGVREKGFHLADFGHEKTQGETGIGGFPEIIPNPVAQVLGLPDVQDDSRLVLHQVHTGSRRKPLDLVL
jgi:hypothetical protein